MDFLQTGRRKHPSAFHYDLFHKPLELYVFIDPLCPECWALEPVIKKLQIEYGRFFTIRHILSGKLSSYKTIKKKNHMNLAERWERTANRTGMSCDGDIWLENPISTPYTASIAIKAAELQGKKPGLLFLRKLQEELFLEKRSIDSEETLCDVAKKANLDVEEFKRDLQSSAAVKAFQCDLKLTGEMDIHDIPTLVFFNHNFEDEGLKVPGNYSYDVYVHVIEEILQRKIKPSPLPNIEQFLSYFRFVATKEISVVYNLPCKEVERIMKKLLIKQKVERVPVKYGTFWRYID